MQHPKSLPLRPSFSWLVASLPSSSKTVTSSDLSTYRPMPPAIIFLRCHLLNYVLRKAPPFPGGKGVRYSVGDNGQKSADKPI